MTDQLGKQREIVDSPTLATEATLQAILAADRPLSGASVNGQVVLASANTWYAVPSTIPTSDYELTASVENGVGTIRHAFANTTTPSTTNGEQAAFKTVVRLAAGQVMYFGSSSASDSINWSTKII